MLEKIIEMEAESLEKARKKINSQILEEGFYIVSENIIDLHPQVKITVTVKQKGEIYYQSLNRPIFEWVNNDFGGENPNWINEIKKESQSALTWFKAQNFLDLAHLSAEIGAEYFTMWSRQAARDGNIIEAWAGWHQVLRFASIIQDEYKIAEACFELGKIYKERGEMYGGGKYWEIAQLFFVQLAYLLKKLGQKQEYGEALWHLGEICLLLDNEPLCKQFWLEAMVIFQTVLPDEALKIEKALQTQF
uniref:Uncharacterized protein n=2 Tax=Gloeothece TaxID=28070 RepID=E0U8K2_GLOV7|nr:hypothetical protein Cyan7822_1761 [Gloeothece verrucosa PCC 7822]